MDGQTRFTIAWRCSLLTGSIVALFWGIWQLIIGPVPVVSEIKMTGDYAIALPFDISRWWDVLMTILLTSLTVFTVTSKTVWNAPHIEGMWIGLIFVMFGVLCFALPIGLYFGLVYGLAIGLVVGLTIGLISWPVSWTFIGLFFGLIYGLPVGLGYVLAHGLIFGMGYGITQAWRPVGKWLLG